MIFFVEAGKMERERVGEKEAGAKQRGKKRYSGRKGVRKGV